MPSRLDVAGGIERGEPRADVLGLPQRERGLARRDREAARRSGRVMDVSADSTCAIARVGAANVGQHSRPPGAASRVRNQPVTASRARRRQHFVLESRGEERDERAAFAAARRRYASSSK